MAGARFYKYLIPEKAGVCEKTPTSVIYEEINNEDVHRLVGPRVRNIQHQYIRRC